MEYIVKTRYKKIGMNGKTWNLPYGIVCNTTSNGQIITYNGIPVCKSHSQDAYDYFVRNDDHKGNKRADLIKDIKSILETHDDDYQTRWNRVWDAPELEKFKRPEHKDFWVWNYDFYNADIIDLEHIVKVIHGGIDNV